MSESPSSAALIEFIAASLVDNPDDVVVRQHEDSRSIQVEIIVAESDMGRIIGKGGNVINSMRAILSVLAAKQGKRVSLEII